MSNSIFDQLRDAARRAAQDLDERFDLKNKAEQGINAAGEVAQKTGAAINEAAGAARERLDKFDERYRVRENLRDKAARAEETLREGARVAQTGAEQFSKTAEDTAREIFGAAQGYYHRADRLITLAAGGRGSPKPGSAGLERPRSWLK